MDTTDAKDGGSSDFDELGDLQKKILLLPSANIRLFFRGIKDLQGELVQRKDDLEAELYFQESQAPLHESIMRQSSASLEQLIEKCTIDADFVKAEVETSRTQLERRVPDLLQKIQELVEMEKLLFYMKALQKITDLNSGMKKCIETTNWASLLEMFVGLSEILTSIRSSKCETFLSFVRETHSVWLDFLSLHLTATLSNELVKFGWPFDSPQNIDMKSETAARICELTEVLVFVWTRSQNNQNEKSPPPQLSLFSDPLAKRFRFHFYGDKKTNSPQKPEWYFTQIIQWVNTHTEFLETKIQPILDKYEVSFSVSAQFMRDLMSLAREKMNFDLNEIRQDTAVFSHCVDEVVVFEMEMRAVGYPTSEANCLDLFSDKALLDLWIQMECDCNTEKVEQLLTSQTAWMDRYQQAADLDEFKVPECADEFLLLLQLISERYRLLRSTEAQFRFLGLQLSLLDDFRVRLVQLLRNVLSPWDTPYPQLMNAVAYVAHVLAEWNDMPFFIKIQGYKYLPSSSGDSSELHREKWSESNESARSSNREMRVFEGAFDGMIDLFKLSWAQMQDWTVKKLVWDELWPSLESYSKEKWYLTAREGERAVATNITASFCQFLLTLRDRLTFLQAKLSWESFGQILRKVLREISKMVLEKLVEETAFTEVGGYQMQYDFLSALLPLMKSYGVEGLEAKFSDLVESLVVLSLKPPTAVLLKDLIDRAKDEEVPGLGKDFGIYSLKRSEIEKLLKRRVDLKLL